MTDKSCIIVFSMRSFLLLDAIILWIISTTNCCMVETINSYVEGGNITVFSFFYTESFDISLFSQLGDADLYVSNNQQLLPTYDPNSYILHSATCGIDTVHVHKRLKRPVYVSVYGHPSYMITFYELSVIPRESTEEDDINFDLLDVKEDSSILYDNISSTENNEKSTSSIRDSREADHSSENKDHTDPSAFFWFLMNTMIEILF